MENQIKEIYRLSGRRVVVEHHIWSEITEDNYYKIIVDGSVQTIARDYDECIKVLNAMLEMCRSRMDYESTTDIDKLCGYIRRLTTVPIKVTQDSDGYTIIVGYVAVLKLDANKTVDYLQSLRLMLQNARL